MSYTPEKTKGIVISILIHILMLLLFFYVGLSYQDPPPEKGVAIVFGFDQQGQGDFTIPKQSVKEVVKPSDDKPVEKVEETNPKEVQAKDDDKLMTSNDDSPVVAKEKAKPSKEELERIKKQKEEQERIRKEKAEQERIKKEQDKKKKNLDSMFSNFDKNQEEGDANQGDDNKPGFKGDVNGDPNARSFVGGSGGDGNYQLGNRKPTAKPKPVYDSKETGIVVVRIIVDQNGRVLFAEAGVKGSTTTDLQLLKRAKEAAMKTTWEGDPSAPEKQEGRIIYNFVIEN